MEEDNFNSKDYLLILELVASFNQKCLQALLGFTTRNSCFDGTEDGFSPPEIYPSTPKASALLKCLHYKLSRNMEDRCVGSSEECILSVDDILQALLMIDPLYITPWNALAEFASGLHNDSMSVVSILQCISSIEEFLLKVKFSFPPSRRNSDEKLVPQCIRELMVHFVEKLTNHLLSTLNVAVETSSIQFSRNNYEARAPVAAKLALELLRTVFTVCKGWCSHLFYDIVSVAHFRRPSPPRIKIWLQLAQSSLPLLTYTHTEKIGMILLDLLCDSSIKISPAQDIPFIISTVVEIASHLGSTPSINDEGSSKSLYTLWRRIVCVGLYQTMTRYDQHFYLQSENCLREGVKKWSVASLKIWISEIIDPSSQSTSASEENTIPLWFSFNLLSLCIEILRDQDFSSKLGLVDKTIGLNLLGSKDYVNCMSGQECQSILDFVLGCGRNSLLNEEIDRVFYRNSGLFYLENDGEEKTDFLSRCGKIIMKSLHFKKCDTSHEFVKKTESSALPRAIRLVSMADFILTNCPDEHLLQASIFAIVVKTVAYFEVPKFRIILEGKIEENLLKLSRLQNSHFSTLRLILYSSLKRENNNEMTGRWIGIIDGRIPFFHINYLNRILTILPLARSSLLNISKKLLAPLYSSWGEYKCEIGTSEQISEPEIQQRIIVGVRGLLELIRSDRWGENEILAWAILSDSLVKDLPPLPTECRRWLFRTLASYVTDGIFDSKTVDRILRATTVRMSSFFVDYEIESKILVSTKQMEEIRSLHRLMATLLRYLATMNGYSESRHIALAQGRESFLRATLLYKKGQFKRNQFYHGVSKQYHSIRCREPGSFILCWLIFLKVNLYLLDNTIVEGSKIETCGRSSMKHETSLLKLVFRIKEIENQDLQVKHGADSDRAIIFPSWLQTQTMVDFDSLKPITMEPTRKFLCLDLLLEFLFLVPLPARESHDLDNTLSWKVVIATGFLMSRKNVSSKTRECFLSIETIRKMAGPFLSISSFLFRGAIDLDCGLSALDDLLVPIVSYCQALHLTLEATEVLDCAGIIGSLWNLYQAVASEKACVKIIKYLESHISKNHAVTTRCDHHLFSLSSVYTESEIDETVQQLRFYCLQPLLSCISFLSYAEEVDTTLTRSLVGGILGALVTDLRAGLDGKSGGVPRQLYLTYCMLIEECGSLLFHQRQSSFDYSIFLLFKDVASTLSNILVTVPLRDAVLFRTTFILAVAVFPSMCRDLVRNGLYVSDSKPNTVGKMLWANSVLFDEVLEDCIDILIRWAALREPCLIPWLDIAGTDHSDTKNDSALSDIMGHDVSNNFNSKQEVDEEIPRFVHVPSPTRNRRKSDSHAKKSPPKIRLYTKELWSWALSCSLLGLEQKWLESERTIQVSDSIENGVRCKVFSIEWKEFFGARIVELQNSLLQINRFFRTSQGLQQCDERGNQIILDMMAMNLPSAPRLRFCCLIECVSRILIHSTRRLCAFLRAGAKSFDRDISVFESICCLSAWLSLKEHPEKDFSVGVFKWLAIASRKSPPGEAASSKKCDKAELFGKLSIVSGQVHKLYLILKELHKLIRKSCAGGDNCFESELTGSFFEGKDTANEILRYTALKLDSLEQVMPNELQVRSFPDFPSSREAEIDPDSLERKRVRSEKRQIMKKSKKKKLRNKNRNKVVDIFMSLDKGSNSPRRNIRDAYADLEDFLVEG